MKQNLIFCLKSNDSFKRIVKQLNINDDYSMNENIKEFDILQTKLSSNEFDLAIIDDRLIWKEEAYKLFNRLQLKHITFYGDFKEIIDEVKDVLKQELICKEQLDSTGCSVEEKNIISSDLEEKEDNREIRYIETEKIIKEKETVKVPVINTMITGLSNKLILVCNLSDHAGATFISTNIASFLSRSNILCNYIELPNDSNIPYIDKFLSIKTKFDKYKENKEDNFYSYPHIIANNKNIEREKEFIDDGIVWIVPDSDLPKIDKWTREMTLKLLYTSKKSNITIVDIGSDTNNESFKHIIREALVDYILVVIEPLAMRLKDNEDKLRYWMDLKYSHNQPIDFIVNKWSNTDKSLLLSCLKVEPYVYVPCIDRSIIYKASYSHRIEYFFDESYSLLSKPLYLLCKLFIPNDYLLDKAEHERNEKASKKVINTIKLKKKLKGFGIFLDLLFNAFAQIILKLIEITRNFFAGVIPIIIIIIVLILYILEINPLMLFMKR